METQSQQPEEEPVTDDEVVLPVEPASQAPSHEDADDTLPLTVDEFKSAGQEVLERVKHGFLVPAYKLGRRYIRSIEDAADSFFDGVANDKKGK